MGIFDIEVFFTYCAGLTATLLFSDIPVYVATTFPIYTKKITFFYLFCNSLILGNSICLAVLFTSPSSIQIVIGSITGLMWVAYTQSYIAIIYLTTKQVLGVVYVLKVMKFISLVIAVIQFIEYIIFVLSLWNPDDFGRVMTIYDKFSVVLISFSEIAYSGITIYYIREMIPSETRIKFNSIIIKLTAIMLMFCGLDLIMMIFQFTDLGVYTYSMKPIFFYIKLRCEYMCLFKLKQIVLVCIQEHVG